MPLEIYTIPSVLKEVLFWKAVLIDTAQCLCQRRQTKNLCFAAGVGWDMRPVLVGSFSYNSMLALAEVELSFFVGVSMELCFGLC